MQRIGIGFDVHRLVRGRKLFLGGVEIPFDMGLEGHSDADVLLHAVCDAILGAVGKGDIGEHFPDTDPALRNVSSLKLLAQVRDMAAAEGYAVANVDTILLAQAPNIKEFKLKIRASIAGALRIEEQRVNIKATTTEGLGFVGRREGMAAYATALLQKNTRG